MKARQWLRKHWRILGDFCKDMMNKAIQQKSGKEPKKKRKYIILLFLAVSTILLIMNISVQKEEVTPQKMAFISCIGCLKEPQSMPQVVLKELQGMIQAVLKKPQHMSQAVLEKHFFKSELDKELDIGVATQEDIENAGQRKNLKTLRLAVNERLYINPITNLTDLEELFISVGTKSPLDLSPIGEMTQLKTLYMFEYYKQAHDVSSLLGNLKELERLDVMRFRVKDLSFLRGMTKLKYLTVYYVADADLAYLENAGVLEDFLYLQGYRIRNPECLSEATKLRSIFLWEMEENPLERENIDMEVFSQMQALERMVLVQLKIDDLAPISELPNLEEIILVDIGVEDIRCLASLPNLKSLEIYGENAEQLKEQAQQYLTGLEFIRVDESIPRMYQ